MYMNHMYAVPIEIKEVNGANVEGRHHVNLETKLSSSEKEVSALTCTTNSLALAPLFLILVKCN